MTTARKRVVLVVLAIAAALAWAVQADAEAKPRICFYVDSPHIRLTGPHKTFRTGHAFIQLLPAEGTEKGRKNLVYGHANGSGWPATDNGSTEDDSEHPWDWKICYEVSDEQYAKAADYVRKEQAHPSDFHLFSTNCTWWAGQVAAAADVALPATTDRDTKINDPAVFESSLEHIGDGRTFHGGVAHKNTKKVTPKDSRDPPLTGADRCSYAGLLLAGERAPRLLAQRTRRRAVVRRFGGFGLGVGRVLTLRLLGAHPQRSLVAVDFGDGTIVRQHSVTRHRFRHAGTFIVTIVIFDSGDVRRESFIAHVSAGGPGLLIRLRISKPAPSKPIPKPSSGPCPEVLTGPSQCGLAFNGDLFFQDATHRHVQARMYDNETSGVPVTQIQLDFPPGETVASAQGPDGTPCEADGSRAACVTALPPGGSASVSVTFATAVTPDSGGQFTVHRANGTSAGPFQFAGPETPAG